MSTHSLLSKSGLSATALAVSLLVGSISVAHAHGAWVAERTGEMAIVYGEGASDDAYDAEKVTVVSGVSTAGESVDVAINAHEHNVTLGIPENTAAVGFVIDNGFWSKNADGEWVNLPKNEVDGAEKGGRYLKNGVRLTGEFTDLSPAQFPELNLVILPDQDPAEMHAGDEVGVTVYFDGKPLADVELTGDLVNDMEAKVATTDSDGKATVAIRNNGLNVIAVSYSVALENDPKADKIGYFSTLSFSNYHDHH